MSEDLPGIATTITVTATMRISINSCPLIAGVAVLSGSCTRNRIRRTKKRIPAALSLD
jgi:hypothetical protein